MFPEAVVSFHKAPEVALSAHISLGVAVSTHSPPRVALSAHSSPKSEVFIFLCCVLASYNIVATLNTVGPVCFAVF